MFNLARLDRQLHAGQFDRLLDQLQANGLVLPLGVRARLAEVPAGAVGLALRRVAELTYGPTPTAGRMLEMIAGTQAPDGSFGRDVVATAAVVAGLGRALDQRAIADPAAAALVRDRAVAWMTGRQGGDGLFRGATDRTTNNCAATSAFVLMLLADDPVFRASVRFAELLDWFEEHRDRLDDDCAHMWSLAMVPTATARRAAEPAEPRTPSPALPPSETRRRWPATRPARRRAG